MTAHPELMKLLNTREIRVLEIAYHRELPQFHAVWLPLRDEFIRKANAKCSVKWWKTASVEEQLARGAAAKQGLLELRKKCALPFPAVAKMIALREELGLADVH